MKDRIGKMTEREDALAKIIVVIDAVIVGNVGNDTYN